MRATLSGRLECFCWGRRGFFPSGTEMGEVVGSTDSIHDLSLQVPLKPGWLSSEHPDLHVG